MGEIVSILDYLAAGGDAAMIALLWVMWRFDRRLLQLETMMINERKDP